MRIVVMLSMAAAASLRSSCPIKNERRSMKRSWRCLKKEKRIGALTK